MKALANNDPLPLIGGNCLFDSICTLLQMCNYYHYQYFNKIEHTSTCMLTHRHNIYDTLLDTI